jgi:cell division protein FtsL
MAGEAIRTTQYQTEYSGRMTYRAATASAAPALAYAPAPAYVPEPADVPVPARDVFIRPPRIILSAREKASLLFLVVLAGLVFFGAIFASAYCAKIQKEINQTNAQSAVVQEEIDKLYIEIEQGRNIQTIEKAAKKNLKMKYPTGDRIKYIGEIKYKKEDLAQYLREKAYGK